MVRGKWGIIFLKKTKEMTATGGKPQAEIIQKQHHSIFKNYIVLRYVRSSKVFWERFFIPIVLLLVSRTTIKKKKKSYGRAECKLAN